MIIKFIGFLLCSGMAGEHGAAGRPGPRGERGSLGRAGLPGMDGAPGVRGEEGQQGGLGERGHGHSDILVVHSFRRAVPDCPTHSTLLWNGYSLLSLSSELPPSPLSSISACPRQFSTQTTLGLLDQDGGSASLWHAAASSDQDPFVGGEEPPNMNVSRCAVCEVEATLLTVHSMSTKVPSCPPTWQGLWTGFSYISSRDLVSCLFVVIGRGTRGGSVGSLLPTKIFDLRFILSTFLNKPSICI